MAAILLCTAAFTTAVLADSLYIHGVVQNQQSQGIANAVVVATFGMGPSARTATDTADASGNYAITTTTSTGAGAGSVQLAASAIGFQTSSVTANVTAPNDGTADTVSQNFTLTAGSTQAGDSLYITGVVTGGGDSIAGAKVIVSILTMTGTQTDSAITNASGVYSIAMVNTNGGRTVGFVVSATGYQNATAQSTIQNPDDGTADRITRNFTLTATVYDTLVITGRVIDSTLTTGLVGASIVYSFFSAGTGITVTDTVVSGANGNFVGSTVVTMMPNNVQWRVEMAGYASKSGQTAQALDSAKIGTVALVALTTADSVAYTVRGRVSDSTDGTAMRTTEVIVVLMRGATVILRDTVTTNNQGNYTATSARVPYVAGSNVVTVSASDTGYSTWTATDTLPTSTTEIVINPRLQAVVGVVRAATVARTANTAHARAFSLNGRSLGAVSQGATLRAGSAAVQQVITRGATGEVQKYVPAR